MPEYITDGMKFFSDTEREDPEKEQSNEENSDEKNF